MASPFYSVSQRALAFLSALIVFFTTIITALVVDSTHSAQAAQEQPGADVLRIGDVYGQMGQISVNDESTQKSPDYSADDCVHYGYGSSYYADTTSAPLWQIATKQDLWSYVSRGYSASCSYYISVGDTSALGFRANNPGDVKAGSQFLVGTMRHNNFPIQTKHRFVHGSIDLNINGHIESFPFDQEETPNNEVPSAIDHTGGAYIYIAPPIGIPGSYYCYDGSVMAQNENGDWGCYKYMGEGYGTFDMYADTDTNGWYGIDSKYYYYPGLKGAANKNPASDDILRINKTTATKIVIDSNGVPYRLVLWGFVPDADGTCPDTPPANSAPVNTFVTKEDQVSYGCLYGSFNQERILTIKKTATADANSQNVTIPEFSFSETLGVKSAEVAGSPSTLSSSKTFLKNGSIPNLKPTALGDSGTAKSESYSFLVGRSDFTITEDAPNPLGGKDSTGWRLDSMKCVNSAGSDVPVDYDVTRRSINFERVGLAPDTQSNEITCTFHNVYEAKTKLTLKKELSGNYPNTVTGKEWTLYATGVSEDQVTKNTTLSGVTGTSEWVPSGTYALSESPNDKVVGFKQKSLVCKDAKGADVAVNDGKVILADGADVTCTWNNEYQTGSIKLTKVLNDPESGFTGGSEKVFNVNYQCGTFNGTTYGGTVKLAAGESQVVNNLPAGARCKISEDQPSGNVKDTSYTWAQPAYDVLWLQPDPTNIPEARITNTLTRNMGTLSIHKEVAPADSSVPSSYVGTTKFAVKYSCTTSGAPFEGTVNILAGSSETIPVPAGSSCTVTEDKPQVQNGEFSAPYFVWKDPIIAPLTDANGQATNQVTHNGTLKTTVKNTYEVDKRNLTIKKKVVGPGGTGDSGYTGTSTNTFAVDVKCGDSFSYTVNVPADGEQVISAPRGASCTVTEAKTDANFNESLLKADFDWNREAIKYFDGSNQPLTNNTVTVADDGSSAVVVQNETMKSYGGIAIAKVVAPDMKPLNSNAKFTFEVSCNAPAQGETQNYKETVSLGAGEVWRNTNKQVPAGTDCTVTETDLRGKSDGLVDESYRWASTGWKIEYGQEHNGTSGATNSTVVTAHAQSTDAEHPFPRVTFTNTYERVYGTFSINKELTVPDSNPNAGADLTYSGTWQCSYAEGTEVVSGTWSRVGKGLATLTVTSGNAALSSDATAVNVLLGSRCSATESTPPAPVADNPSFYWLHTTPESTVTVSSEDAKQLLTVDNHIEKYTAGITLSKQVEGGEAGVAYDAQAQFSFDFTCKSISGIVYENKDQKLTAGGSMTLKASSGQDIAAGSTCTISESATMPPSKDPYRWDQVKFAVSGTGVTNVSNADRSVTFTLPADKAVEAAVSVTNVMSEHRGKVAVKKTVDSQNKAQGFVGAGQAMFTVNLQCSLPGETATTFQPATIADDGTATFDVLLGSSCSVVETTPSGGLKDASYVWGDYTSSHDGTPTSGTDNRLLVNRDGDNGTFTVTNKIERAYGTMQLSKEIVGVDLASNYGRDVTYSGTFQCTHEGDEPVNGNWTIVGPGTVALTAQDSAGKTVDLTKANTLLPLNSTCVPTEVAPSATATNPKAAPVVGNPSYVWGKSGATAEVASAIVEADRTNAMVVKNEIIQQESTVNISKAVEGEVAGMLDPQQKFTINASCVDEAKDFFDPRTIDVTNGATAAFKRAVPRGWTCTLSESALGQDTLKDISYRWATPSYRVSANGQDIALTDGHTFVVPMDAQSIDVKVTNRVERVTGKLDIATAYGPAAQTAGEKAVKATAEFSGTYQCVYAGQEIAKGTWTSVGASSATLTSVSGIAPDALPLTTSCTVTEDTPAADGLVDSSWAWTTPSVTYPITDGNATAATVGSATDPAKAVVTNDVQRVYTPVEISTEFEGNPGVLTAGQELTVAWRCTSPNDPKDLLEGAVVLPVVDGHIRLTDAAGANIIPAGWNCRVRTESPTADAFKDSSWSWIEPGYKAAYAALGTNPDFEVKSGLWSVPTSTSGTAYLRVVTKAVREYGSINVLKNVTGDVQKSLQATTDALKNEYVGRWMCTAEDGTVKAGSWYVLGTGNAQILSDEGDTQILAGSTCTVTENSRPEQPVSVDASYEWTVPITSVPVEAKQAVVRVDALADFAVTNETKRMFSELALAKAPIANAAEGAKPDGIYKVGFICRAGDGTVIHDTVDVTAGGERVTTGSIIPRGAACSVAEIPPGSDITSLGGVAIDRTVTDLNIVDPNKYQWDPKVRYMIDGGAIGDEKRDGLDNTFTFDLLGDRTDIDVVNTLNPAAQVEKTYVGTSQNMVNGVWDGTWNVEYSIKVTNPSVNGATKYSLIDRPQVPAGVMLKYLKVTYPDANPADSTPGVTKIFRANANVAAGEENLVDHGGKLDAVIVPEPVTLPDGSVQDGRRELGASDPASSETFTVVMNISNPSGDGVLRPDQLPQVKEKCTERNANEIVDLHNIAFVTSAGITVNDGDCGAVPSNFSVEKKNIGAGGQGAGDKGAGGQGAGVVAKNDDGTFTARYEVRVTNRSTSVTSGILKDVTDTMTIPDAAAIRGVLVTEQRPDGQGGMVALEPVKRDDVVAGQAWTLAKVDPLSEIPLAPGQSRVFEVAVTFAVDQQSNLYDWKKFQCGSTDAYGKPLGIHNVVNMEFDSDGSANNVACQNVDLPRPAAADPVPPTPQLDWLARTGSAVLILGLVALALLAGGLVLSRRSRAGQ
ncbi:hypothetical protein JOD55_000393 [Arcanobacterium pluranimalium]|uniref:DUF5979 domain-containing protein n=1 Tax=Arcanobacterium pluranimalium TaxID=108028 RepID=UPI00195DCCAF|nr:DUF5979 domain-containing protein [Arcanobacterium pluranimalium]MBM7824566.1 hypothetical protein [Arcanobacterium pluranimalium]